MNEELQIGNIVIVTGLYESPKYKGIIIGLTKDFVEVRELGVLFGTRTHLEKREYVQKMI